MSKPTPPAPTASAVGPCPTLIQYVGHPGTGSLPSTIAPPTTHSFTIVHPGTGSYPAPSPDHNHPLEEFGPEPLG